jgi:hypothetical protein
MPVPKKRLKKMELTEDVHDMLEATNPYKNLKTVRRWAQEVLRRAVMAEYAKKVGAPDNGQGPVSDGRSVEPTSPRPWVHAEYLKKRIEANRGKPYTRQVHITESRFKHWSWSISKSMVDCYKDDEARGHKITLELLDPEDRPFGYVLFKTVLAKNRWRHKNGDFLIVDGHELIKEGALVPCK